MTTPTGDNDSVHGTVDYYYDYDENYSDVEPCYIEIAYNFLSLHVYPIVVVLGLLGNLLVIVTYALYKKTKSMTDVCLLNVAVADMLFVLVLPLIIYNEQQNWVMGDAACKVLSGAYSLNLYSGALLQGCLSVDRYLTTVFTSRSQNLPSRRLAYSCAICTVVWIAALLVSLPTFIYSTIDLPEPFMLGENSDKSEDPEHTRECVFYFNSVNRPDHVKILLPSLQMAIGLLVPLMVMTFCYSSIILTLLKTSNFQRHKMVLTVVLVFIILHLPYNLTLLVRTITLWHQTECSSEIAILVGLGITRTLAYMHCCINPILYTFMDMRFRRALKRILQDLCCTARN